MEKLSKQSVDQQFTCSWELEETAIANATGKDSDIKLTEDYFANKNPKVNGKIIQNAIHHISKHYTKYNG